VSRPATTRLAALLAAAAGLLPSAGASAAESCTLSGGSANFGIYDPIAAAPLDTTGTLQVTCTSGLPVIVDYEIHLDTGQGGSFVPRAMTNGSSLLTYNLYTDATRTVVWGDGTGGTGLVSIKYALPRPGVTQTDTWTVYGRIGAGQVVSTGTYLDTITVTLVF
jgi:spore coat protein U-like protein